MPTHWNSNSNSNSEPETVQDFIDLLIAVKEKYGNLKVRRCNYDDTHVTEEYHHFDDIMVNQNPQSLIRSNNDNESYLVFVG